MSFSVSENSRSPASAVAIHQPNYAPWLGYFRKIACADYFVFLDNVQFSRHSYTNRVRITQSGAVRWLTQPVRQQFGQKICDVRFADNRWARKHLDIVRGAYGSAGHFQDVWRSVVAMYESMPSGELAKANEFLIETISRKLDLACTFFRASDFTVGEMAAEDRLIDLVSKAAPGGTYLSGAGGATYQDPTKFASAGVPLRYVAYEHPVYPQGGGDFCAGLSILDVVFHVGWDRTRSLIVEPQTVGEGARARS